MAQAQLHAEELTAIEQAVRALDAQRMGAHPALAVQIAELKKHMDAMAADASSGKSVAKTVPHCREELVDSAAAALVRATGVVVYNRMTVERHLSTPEFWYVHPGNTSNAAVLADAAVLAGTADCGHDLDPLIAEKEQEHQRPGAQDVDAKLGEHATQLAGMAFTGIGSFLAHDPRKMYCKHWPVSAEGGWEKAGMDTIVASDGSMTVAEADAEAAKLQGATQKLQEAVAALHHDCQNTHKCVLGEAQVYATEFALQQVQHFGTAPLDGLRDKTKALLQGACLSLDDNVMGEHADDDVNTLINKREEDIAAPEVREHDGNAMSAEEHEKANDDAKTSGRAVCDMLKNKLEHVEKAIRTVEDQLQRSKSSESDVRQAPAWKANAEWLAGESVKMQQVMANMRTNLEQWLSLHESMRETDDKLKDEIQAQMDKVLADMTDVTGDPSDPDSECGGQHSRSWGGTCVQQRGLVVQHAELETQKNFKIAGQELKDEIKHELESKVTKFTEVLTRSDEMVQNTVAKLEGIREELVAVREACTGALEKRLGELKARRDWLTRQLYTNVSVLRHHIATCYIIECEFALNDTEKELLEAVRECKLACRSKGSRNADKRKAAMDAVAHLKAQVRDCQNSVADARKELAAVDDHFKVDNLADDMRTRKLEPLSRDEDRFYDYDIEHMIRKKVWEYVKGGQIIDDEHEARTQEHMLKHNLLTDGCSSTGAGADGADGGGSGASANGADGGGRINASAEAWTTVGIELLKRSTGHAVGEAAAAAAVQKPTVTAAATGAGGDAAVERDAEGGTASDAATAATTSSDVKGAGKQAAC